MNNHHEVGQAGCKANVDYYRSLRVKYASLAIEAMSNERIWEARLAAQKSPENALKTLLTRTED